MCMTSRGNFGDEEEIMRKSGMHGGKGGKKEVSVRPSIGEGENCLNE